MSDSRTDTQTADNQHVLIDVEVENDDLLDHHDSQMVSQMSDDEDGEELHPGKAPAKWMASLVYRDDIFPTLSGFPSSQGFRIEIPMFLCDCNIHIFARLC